MKTGQRHLRHRKKDGDRDAHVTAAVPPTDKKTFTNMTIAVDFDGTIVEDKYPKIGREIPFATDTLKMLAEDRHRIILWSVREGTALQEAVEWCRARGVEFYAVNKDYPEEDGPHSNDYFSRKLKVDVFIDDRQIGGLPEWGEIYRMIKSGEPFSRSRQDNSYVGDGVISGKKKKWWHFQ